MVVTKEFDTGRLELGRKGDMLENFGMAALAEIFGDWIVYRNLEPLDKRVPGFKKAAWQMGVSEDRLPRKQEMDYAKAATWIINEAQSARGERKPVRELLFLGDTLYNDGQAYANMARAGGWKGSCFIGADRNEQAPTFTIDAEKRLYNANRWAAVADWLAWVREEEFALDERTAVVVDIDKTALGAKGRNDAVIDHARLEGIFRTMHSVLGEDAFKEQEFIQHYNDLNRSKYHFLTADNQDYLAYICMVVNSGLISFQELMSEIENSNLEDFEQFIRWVDSRMMLNQTGGTDLFETHQSVITSVRVGDPTPFKSFRRQEFIATVEHMGNLPANAEVADLLAQEITLTEEIWQASAWLKERGCFLICLSDKPDEASRPSKGYPTDLPPLHRARTHRVGIDLSNTLATIQ